MKINPLLTYNHMELVMAVVDANNTVKNIIIADENSPVEDGTYLVPVRSNQFVSIGFTWDGQNFLNEDGVPVIYNE